MSGTIIFASVVVAAILFLVFARSRGPARRPDGDSSSWSGDSGSSSSYGSGDSSCGPSSDGGSCDSGGGDGGGGGGD